MFKGYERGGVHYDRYGRVVSFRVLHYYYDRGTRYVRVDLPISKIYPAYKELKAGRIPQRGGLGLDLRLLKVRQAKRLGLPEELVSQLIRRFGDETRIWRVDSTVSITEAQEKFKPGDLILKVKGKWLQKGFQNLEETLNKNIGKELEIEFLRSKKVEKATLKVLDLNKQKLKSFIAFAGGVFHPIHWEARKANPLKNLKGVYLSFQSYGSPIQMYGLSPGVLVKKINDQAIKGFDHFIELLKEFKERQQVRVTLLELTKQRQLTVPLKVDTRFFPLRSFHLTRDPDSFALHWQEKDN